METSTIYTDNVSEYATCKSITKIAKNFGVSEERVRRTLITEGLWTSRSAKPIIKLYHEGKTVPEIAEILMISEKNSTIIYSIFQRYVWRRTFRCVTKKRRVSRTNEKGGRRNGW